MTEMSDLDVIYRHFLEVSFGGFLPEKGTFPSEMTAERRGSGGC